MPSPRVSIGVPVYNGERFLEEAVRSLLQQTYTDFEIIISDNASIDRTGEIAARLAAEDPRLRYVRNDRNFGVAYNLTRLFELSRGEYFRWAAADDLCAPDYLARCVDVLEGDPMCVLAHTRAVFIDEAGRTLDVVDRGWDLRSADPAQRLRYVIEAGHWVNAIFGVIRSNALRRTRLVGAYPGGDYRLLGDLAVLGTFVELPDRLFARRLHPDASRAHRTDLAWQIAFHTGKPTGIIAPRWSRIMDHFRTVVGAPLPPRAKLALTGTLLRRVYWHHRELRGELWAVATHYAWPLLRDLFLALRPTTAAFRSRYK